MSIQPSPSMRWYVACTHAHREQMAIENLQRQGFTAFTPYHHVTTRQRGRFASRLAPLFPRYIFVSFDAGRDAWRSINGTRGVVGLISASDAPLPLKRDVAEELQAAMDEAGVITLRPKLQAGDDVRLVAGPFAGMRGTLEELDERGRITVLLACLGAPLRTSVPQDSVVPSASRPAQRRAVRR